MELTIARATLLRAAGRLVKVAAQGRVPILETVLIDAEASGLVHLHATDQQMTITLEVAAAVATPGQVAVSAEALHEVARRLDSAELTLQGDAGGLLTIRAGRFKSSLNTLDPRDWPTARIVPGLNPFTIPSKDLLRMIDRVAHAMSKDSSRFHLNGFYLHVAGDSDNATLRAVATDGHRLARVDAPLPAGALAMRGVIVPREVTDELRRLCEMAEQLDIDVDERRLLVTAAGVSFATKLVDGVFPEYERVIPSDLPYRLTVNRTAFQAIAERVGFVGGERDKQLRFSLEQNGLTLSMVDEKRGRAMDTLGDDHVVYPGPELLVGFQARYVRDCIAQLAGGTIELAIGDATGPANWSDPDDPAALYTLMPVRVSRI